MGLQCQDHQAIYTLQYISVLLKVTELPNFIIHTIIVKLNWILPLFAELFNRNEELIFLLLLDINRVLTHDNEL